MPSTYDARAARWPGQDFQADLHLTSQGFTLTRDGRWEWVLPDPEYHVTARDWDAIMYLVQEWDFGGLREPKGAKILWVQPAFSEEDYDAAFRAAPEWIEPEPPQFMDIDFKPGEPIF